MSLFRSRRPTRDEIEREAATELGMAGAAAPPSESTGAPTAAHAPRGPEVAPVEIGAESHTSDHGEGGPPPWSAFSEGYMASEAALAEDEDEEATTSDTRRSASGPATFRGRGNGRARSEDPGAAVRRPGGRRPTSKARAR